MHNPDAYTMLPEGIKPAISRDAMAALPVRRYEGPLCVVTTRTELNNALADIQQETVVGFDTETRPAFRKGVRYDPALVQVATARMVYLFQLRRVDVIPGLAEMLISPHIVKVGVAVGRDIKELKEVFAFAVLFKLNFSLFVINTTAISKAYWASHSIAHSLSLI